MSRQMFAITLCIPLVSAALTLPAAAAPKNCPSARTVTGECVNPALTDSLRGQAIANTQQKLSYTSPPWLPSADQNYLIAHNWNEILTLFAYPAVGRTPQTFRRP